MGIPIIFVLFLIFLFIFQHHLRKTDRLTERARKEFWNREENSLFTRKSPIEKRDFLQPKTENLPRETLDYFIGIEKEELFDLQEKCFELARNPMLDLSDLLNSEVKLKYGSSNLELIGNYEINYNHYIQSLYQLGKGYYDANKHDKAIKVLEEGIQIHTNISDHIILLASLYWQNKNYDHFNQLYDYAINLHSLTKNKIIHHLNELQKNT